ncbi:MAG: BTAD domain-containing putative transcriptional regulator [Dongiaceae bacterium]
MDTPISSPVCVRVLGGFELSGGGDLTLSGKKLRALVALLALAPHAGWSRERLTELLWGDRDEEQARGSLRQALAELRRILGDSALLADRETVALDPAALRVDAVEFAALYAAGAWEEAAALYRGDLLDGVSLPDAGFADWLLVERTRLHDLAVRALARLLDTQSGAAAIATARRLLELDPNHEATHRALMRLHAAEGDRSLALRQYQLCRDQLRRDLGVKPEPETEQLFRAVQASTKSSSAAQANDRPLPATAATAEPSQSPDVAIPGASIDARPRRAWQWWAAAAAMLVLAAGIAGWWRPWATEGVAPVAWPLPDKPSIAVLPFENISDDPRQAYFADGIAEDLLTDLSRISGLFVIARNSTFAYKGKSADVQEVARELGVRYVIEGSVRRAGDKVRINVQLVDATTGAQHWAQRYDGSVADIFALQDQVTGAVVNALSLRLTAGDQQTLAQHETIVPDAYDAFLRGWEFYRRATPDNFAKAIPHFERAIELDPAYGRAHAALAMIYFQSYDQAWAGHLQISANDAYRRARDYLTIAKKYPTSTSHQVAGNMSRGLGWYDDALSEFKAAIALDPNDSWTYAYAAYALIRAGRAAEAEAQIQVAMRLDPHPPPLFVFYQGLAQFALDRLPEAAATLEEAARLSPDDPWPTLYLAATYGRADRTSEAAAVMLAFNATRIKLGGVPFVINQCISKLSLFGPAEQSRLFEGLRRAGVPDRYGSGAFDEQKLTAGEIDSLFFSHRLHGRSLGSGEEYGASVAADGTAMMFGAWGAGNGVAQFDGDRLCFVWTGGTTNCGAVFRNPGGTRVKENEFVWFSHQAGEYSFSQAE